MRRLATFLVCALLLATTMPATAMAAELRQGDNVIVGPGEVVNDDLYIFGGSLSISGRVTGDVVAAGGNVTVAGNVDGDLFAAAGDVSISGNVGGNVRVAGGNVRLDGTVAKDLLVAGGSVSAGEGDRIGRDVWLAAGSGILAGEIGRELLAGTSSLVLNGRVGRDVRATTARLTIGERAFVLGKVRYASESEAEVRPGAVLSGGTERDPREIRDEVSRTPMEGIGGWIQGLVGFFALGALFVLALPRFARRCEDELRGSPWMSLGLGAGLLFGVPLLALAALGIGIAVGGWWLGPLGLMVYAIALLLGIVVSATYVGRWLLLRAGQPLAHPLAVLLTGLVLFGLAGLVPVLGGLLVFVALLFGLGALGLAAIHAPREQGQPSPGAA